MGINARFNEESDILKLRKFIKNDQAVLGYFIVFLFGAIMLVFLYSFAAPFLIAFTTDMYIAGDDILANAESKIADISNVTIRNRIQNSLDAMQDSTAYNIEYLGFFYQYGWILIVLVLTFTIFILARKTVETRGYTGVV